MNSAHCQTRKEAALNLNLTPVAFMSYAHAGDAQEEQRLSHLREQLTREISIQIGEPFEILYDRQDMLWGRQWQLRIEGGHGAPTVLIPVITPAFFNSRECRHELEQFLQRERRLGRQNLVAPIYYFDSALLDNPFARARDSLAQTLATRSYVDWRALRFEPLTTPVANQQLSAIARLAASALSDAMPSHAVVEHDAACQKALNVPEDSQEAEPDCEPVPVHPPLPALPLTTLVVDALGRGGGYTSLHEALAAAPYGARIVVRPGVYQGGLTLDKPVEIVGEGERAEIVIQACGRSVIQFQASMARLANLTLRQTGGGDWYGVDIAQGRLDIESCDISSQSLACVVIHGDADPRLRRNIIHNGRSAGVLVYNGGRGVLEDNAISHHALSGVEILEGGNPTLRRNRIYEGGQSGVYVHRQGRGLLEDNEIFGNAGAGVSIKDGGNPVLCHNRIYSGRASGVFVYESGQGWLEDNEIFANAFAGVEIKSGGSPTLHHNLIHDGHHGGVYIHDNGQGQLDDNDIFNNRFAGVELKDHSHPLLSHNRIHHGRHAGVYAHDNGRDVLQDNQVFANAGAGVVVLGGGNPTLLRNRIFANACYGVWVHADGSGTFEDNELTDNAKGAWNIDQLALTRVRRRDNLPER